jgi:hypothetical protein
MRVKNIVMTIAPAVMFLGTSGCASYMNTQRVVNNVAESRIRTSGDKELIEMIDSGISPKRAVQVSATSGGAKVMFNVSDLAGIKAWGTAFKEAPVSSTGALILDAGAAYLLYDQITDDGGSSKRNSVPSTAAGVSAGNDIGDNNTFNNFNFSGDGSTFSDLNVGDQNFAPPEE